MMNVLGAMPLEYRQLHELVQSFAALVMQALLFPRGHPAVERSAGAMYLKLCVLLERKKSVELRFSDGALRYLNFEINLKDASDRAIHLLRERLARHSIAEIEFVEGTSKEEITCLARLIASQPCGASGAELASLGAEVRNIKVRSVAESRREISADRAIVPSMTSVVSCKTIDCNKIQRDSPKEATGLAVRNILDRLEKIDSMQGSAARAAIMDIIERERSGTSTLLLLNSLKEFDEYTFSHSVNVAVISAAIARELGFPVDFIDGIAHAALLHDMGKLYIPKVLLQKSGRLTPVEWQKMKRHPIDGERILREEGLPLLCRRVAYEHHLRHDLTGYPAVNEGYLIHEASEIVRIADSYDALTTMRPYRNQLNPYEAIKLMARTCGSEFHKEYFSAFLKVLGNIPIGSILQLSTGETAVVVGFGESKGDPPRLRLLTDAYGRKIPGEVYIDLKEIDPATGSEKRKIVSILEDPIRNVEVGRYVLV